MINPLDRAPHIKKAFDTIKALYIRCHPVLRLAFKIGNGVIWAVRIYEALS